MSEKSSKNSQDEEIGLGQLLFALGRLFEKIFAFIKSIFKSIFDAIIFLIKVLIDNYKLVFGSMIIAAAIGYGLEKTKKQVYISQMMVKPYFDSKFQLVTNVNYYNALIGDKDYDQLKQIFKLKGDDAAKQLLNFEILPGPENENEQLKDYDEFVKSIDSIMAQDVSFQEFLDNRSIYSANIFQINVKSYNKDIFRFLEEGLNTSFSNAYSAKKMEKRDSILKIEENRIITSLSKVDSLQRVYIDIKKEESKSNAKSFSTQDGVTYIEQHSETKEFELLETEMKLRAELSDLETQRIEENEFFDTLSSFQEVGSKYKNVSKMYSLILPILVFIILTLGYAIRKTIVFVKNHEE